ncbi:MAG: hypothetical protein QJR08_06650 [Bacillota bacterium]|nr:hypothetical protein [Bacillota bacterium]
MERSDGGLPGDRQLAELEQALRPWLARYLVREPSPEASRRLAEEVLLRARAERERDPAQARRPSLPRLVRLELAGYGRAFWIASLALGVLLVLASADLLAQPGPAPVNLFAAVLPGYFLAAMALGNGWGNRAMRLVESVTPFPPALLWLIRLLIATAVDVLIGLAGTGVLAATVGVVQPLAFLLQWLAGVLAVGGLLAWLLFSRGFLWSLGAGVVFWAVLAAGQEGLIRAGSAWSLGGDALLLVLGAASTAAAWHRSRAAWLAGAGSSG